MYSDNFDSVTNNLRDSANGTFVTSDDTFPAHIWEVGRLRDLMLGVR